MASLIIGYGVQGKKRIKYLKDKSIILDNKNKLSDFNSISQINLKKITHAYVCTPESYKFFYIKKLLQNNIKVLIEKPLSLTKKQFREISSLIKKNSVCLYTAYNHRFEPHLITVKNELKKKTIGKIYKVNLYYGNGTARLWKNDWRENKKNSILHDLGVHLIDTFNFWFGYTPKKYKVDVKLKNELKCYDYISFSSRKNISVTFTTSIINWRNHFQADIIGSKGSIHVECLCKWGPSKLTIRKRKFPSGKPSEKIKIIRSEDPTWRMEEDYFRKLKNSKDSNLKNDIIYSKILNEIK